MSVYVGIDVDRKRSQIAIADQGDGICVNRNVPNGRVSALGVIGDPPMDTPVAFEAAFGWCRLVELLQEHGFEPPWCICCSAKPSPRPG
ncbi:hypothetical protein [Streptomyces sp. NPDC054794]